MGSIRTVENIAKLVKLTVSTLQLPASRLNIGAAQYSTSALTLNAAVTGVGGVDVTVAAGSLYYVYAVVSSGTVYLIASLNSSLPSGFTQARKVGSFNTNGISAIDQVSFIDSSVNSPVIPGGVGLVDNTASNTAGTPIKGNTTGSAIAAGYVGEASTTYSSSSTTVVAGATVSLTSTANPPAGSYLLVGKVRIGWSGSPSIGTYGYASLANSGGSLESGMPINTAGNGYFIDIPAYKYLTLNGSTAASISITNLSITSSTASFIGILIRIA